MQQNCYLLYADQLSIIVTRASAARIVSARNKAAVQKAPGNSLCSVISRAAHSKHRIKGSFIPVTGICLEQYIPCPITLVLHFLIYKKTLFFFPTSAIPVQARYSFQDNPWQHAPRTTQFPTLSTWLHSQWAALISYSVGKTISELSPRKVKLQVLQCYWQTLRGTTGSFSFRNLI